MVRGNEVPCFGDHAVTPLFVAEAFNNGPGKGSRLALHPDAPIVAGDPLYRLWPGHDRNTGGHGFENFVLDATGNPEWGDEYSCLGKIRADVGDKAGNVDVLPPSGKGRDPWARL